MGNSGQFCLSLPKEAGFPGEWIEEECVLHGRRMKKYGNGRWTAAERYSADKDKAEVAALSHDIGKNMNVYKLKKLIELEIIWFLKIRRMLVWEEGKEAQTRKRKQNQKELI